MSDNEVLAVFMGSASSTIRWVISNDGGKTHVMGFRSQSDAVRTWVAGRKNSALTIDYEVVAVPGIWDAPRYDSDDAPRSLLAGVEAKIVERGWAGRMETEMYERYMAEPNVPAAEETAFGWWCLTLPAAVRAAAAAKVVREQGGQA